MGTLENASAQLLNIVVNRRLFVMQMYVVEAQTSPSEWEPITIHMTLYDAEQDYHLFKGEMHLRIATYQRTGFVDASTKVTSEFS